MRLQNNQFKASMKYLLINQETGEQTLCDKVTIDGFDYYAYACHGEIRLNDPVTDKYRVWFWGDNFSLLGTQKVIATNNPNIDIPKVVDEVEKMSKSLYPSSPQKAKHFIAGYTKSQETHPFSEEDMIEFNKWICDSGYMWNWKFELYTLEMIPSERIVKIHGKSAKELLELWKSQQPKKVYYNLLFNTK